MKVITSKTQEFTPVTLTVTFESQTEIDRMQNILRSAQLHNRIINAGFSDVSDILRSTYNALSAHSSAMGRDI